MWKQLTLDLSKMIALKLARPTTVAARKARAARSYTRKLTIRMVRFFSPMVSSRRSKAARTPNALQHPLALRAGW